MGEPGFAEGGTGVRGAAGAAGAAPCCSGPLGAAAPEEPGITLEAA